MKTYSMRVVWKVEGGHTHCAIFTGQTHYTHGMAGIFTMTNEEFEAWKNGAMKIEFIQKEKNDSRLTAADER